MGEELQLVPIDGETFAASMRVLVEDYVDSLVQDLHMDPADARTSTEQTISKVFPDGVATPGMLFFAGDVAGESVGWVWAALPEAPERPETAHIYSLYVHQAYRRRGFGRALMRAIEAELARRGVPRVALNVFGHNKEAIALYEGLGYEPASLTMSKPLIAELSS
jgi:ribosomal protein S18 acetylase RimI-like enzyme